MAKLLYGAENPDIRYKVGHSFSDPVFVLDTGKRQYIFLDNRELEIIKKENKKAALEVKQIYPLIKLARKNNDETAFRNKIAFSILKSYAIKKIAVSEDFPVDIADYIRKKKISLMVQRELYPERKLKTKREIAIIQGVLKRMHKAFQRVEEILKASKVKGNSVFYRNVILTSEFLKKEIDLVFMVNGLIRSGENIVSCGSQAAIPHHHGKGKIIPNVPIVVDLFPRDQKTGYFGDMTRTYVKGRPSNELRMMNDVVLEAQKAAIREIRAGVNGKKIHEICLKVFEDKGFKTEKGEGFIHATGHGLGLEIHERPALGQSNELLEEGNVVTIEPGLYYKKLGGIRIEDVVLVTKKGSKNLTNYPRRFIF